jgi:hypothetical protein
MSVRDSIRLSRLRREAFRLLRECETLLGELMHPGGMIAGSFYGMRKRCGRPGCRCGRGRLHGPFPVIAMSGGGRRTTRSVPRERAAEVGRRAQRHRLFQRRRRRLQAAMRRIVEIVAEIRQAHLEGFP